jgi:hypothetical protein
MEKIQQYQATSFRRKIKREDQEAEGRNIVKEKEKRREERKKKKLTVKG